MFTKEDIMTRLAKGEDAQTIADEMAKTLNEAVQEQKQTNDKAAQREELIDATYNALNLYMEYFGADEEVTVEEATAIVDEIIELVEVCGPLLNLLEKHEVKPVTARLSSKDPDKAISDFLKVFVD